MLEFKVTEKLLPNNELLNAINTFNKKIINVEIIECPYIENGKIIDRLLLVHK